ncbi:MAG: OmpA family protein [Bacteroidia bacterium]
MKFILHIVVFFSLLTTLTFGQSISSDFINANTLYNDKAYSEAIPKYLHSLKKSSANTEAIAKLADCYRLTNDPVHAEEYYKKALNLTGSQPINQLYLAEALMQQKKYEEAKKWLVEYNANVPEDNRGYEHLQTIKQLNSYYEDSAYVKIKKININSNQADFSPILYNKGIIYTSSRKKFSLVQRHHAWTGQNFLSLYYAERKGNDYDQFSKPVIFGPEIKTNYNNGPLTISKDSSTIYFSRNNPNGNSTDGIIKLEIYETHISIPGSIHCDQEVIPFRWNSNTYNTTHPCLSADGKTLFFASDMKLGYGGMDLYMCKREDNSWSEPENLGPKINTAGNEVFPYLAENGTLYFSSDGLNGLGGLDIFESKPLNGTYASAENIGAPINSSMDDFGIFVMGKNGYFSSNRINKGTDDDIFYYVNSKPEKPQFYFKSVDSLYNNAILATIKISDAITKEIIPNSTDENGLTSANLIVGHDYVFEVTAMGYNKKVFVPNINGNSTDITIPMSRIAIAKSTKLNSDSSSDLQSTVCLIGTAYGVNEKIKTPLSATNIIVIDKSTRQKITESTTDALGNYRICNIPAGKKYILKTALYNYLSSDAELNTTNASAEVPVFQNFSFNKITVGKADRVANIKFDNGKWAIRPETAAELDKITNMMLDNPKIVIELSVHTDCRGSAQSNFELSDNRARALDEYLVNKNIESKRVTYTGYGETILLNKCECEGTVEVPCTEAEHQVNNRTELKVIGFLRNGVIYSE